VTQNISPTDAKTLFLVCEAARQEPGGKLTLIGLFPSRRIHIPANTKTAILNLSFVFILSDGEGHFTTKVTLIDPKGVPMIANADVPPVDRNANGTSTVNINIAPFQSAERGRFTIILSLNETRYERTFEVVS